MKETLVVKYGSTSVAGEDGMDKQKLARYAEQIARLNERYGVVVVSSGAVAVGECLWRKYHKEAFKDSGQPFAMLGSAHVVTAWQEAFGRENVLAGQLLVTHREISDPSEGWSLRNVLAANLRHGIVTVANENDALSIEELAELAYGGDNDGLASNIARILTARALCLMSDKEGLLDGKASLQQVMLTQEAQNYARSLARESESPRKRGMKTKVNAAIEAANIGIDSYIASADSDIEDVLSGRTGTHFVAKTIRRVK